MEPLIVDPLNKGYNRNNPSTKDASQGPKCSQKGWSKCTVLFISTVRVYTCWHVGIIDVHV